MNFKPKDYDTSNWKEFKINDNNLFDLYSSKNSLDKIKIVDINELPKDFNYISRSDVNNGINLKVCKQNIEINKGHCLTIGLDTQTSFYQEQDFYTGQNIQILRIRRKCSKYTYLFLSSIIKLVIKNKFQWGSNGATLGRLKKLSIKLPIDDNGDPDWEYMENEVKNMYSFVYENFFNELNNFKNVNIDTSSWKQFKISSFFTFEKGYDLSPNKNDVFNTNEGDLVKCLVAKNNNCGIGGYKLNPIKTWNKDGLAIIAQGDGGAGLSYYVDAPFCANKCVWVLIPKNNIYFNKYVGLFLSSLLSKYKSMFSHSNGLNFNKVKNLSIKLPIDDNGDPDWEYMEKYVKSLPYSKYL